MSNEELLKRVALWQKDPKYQDGETIEIVCDLAAALRESERQHEDTKRRFIEHLHEPHPCMYPVTIGAAGFIAALRDKLAESERQLAERISDSLEDQADLRAERGKLVCITTQEILRQTAITCQQAASESVAREIELRRELGSRNLELNAERHAHALTKLCALADVERLTRYQDECHRMLDAMPDGEESCQVALEERVRGLIAYHERLTRELAEARAHLAEARRQRDEAYADLRSDGLSRATDELARRSGK